MDGRKRRHVRRDEVIPRLAAFIAERRCWPACSGPATVMVTRADGIEVPKCAYHARTYPSAKKRAIGGTA